MYVKLLKAFLITPEDSVDDDDDIERTVPVELTEVEDSITPGLDGAAEVTNGNKVSTDSESDDDLEFYITDEKGTTRESRITMNEPVPSTPGRLILLVCWPAKMATQYNTHLLSSLPQIFKFDFFAKRPQESVSLYKCLEAFLKEEPLGPEDMWSVCILLAFFFQNIDLEIFLHS